MTQDSTTCKQYSEALESSRNITTRSCAKDLPEHDDLIFDTTIRQNSVVTSYGFTCDSQGLTEVYGYQNKLIYKLVDL